MVESISVEGDGVVRNTRYAKFRTSKPASPGYSHELISVDVEEGFEDNIAGQKFLQEGP